MSHARYPRPCRPSRAALAALDFGLQVRVEGHSLQRTIFSGAKDLSVLDLVSELSELVLVASGPELFAPV